MEISRYQELAEPAVKEVLSRHGLAGGTMFTMATDGEPRWVASFSWNGAVHEIEVYVDSIVMVSGKQLFEIYLKNEFGSAEIEVESFTHRLDRYLSGGEW